MSKYIDPLVDFSFKKLFGSEPNKDLLISLLNSIFHEKKTITEVVFSKNEYVGDHKDIGAVIFDLVCIDESGEHFLIEVQRRNQKNLENRMLYYGSKLISDQAPKGKRSVWNYQFQTVNVVVLMDGFTLFENYPGYYHKINLCHTNGRVVNEKLGFVYIELKRFNKQSHELKTNLDEWLFVLKNLSELEDLPHFLNKSMFEKLFDIAQFINLTKNEQIMYDVDLKRRWDSINIMNYAINEGLEKGLKQGLEQGLQEGLEQGLKQGLEQGLQEGLEQGLQEGLEQGLEQGIQEGMYKSLGKVVRNLIKDARYTDNEICEIADVTFAFIEKIRSEFD